MVVMASELNGTLILFTTPLRAASPGSTSDAMLLGLHPVGTCEGEGKSKGPVLYSTLYRTLASMGLILLLLMSYHRLQWQLDQTVGQGKGLGPNVRTCAVLCVFPLPH